MKSSRTSSTQHAAGLGAGAGAWLALGSRWPALLMAPEHEPSPERGCYGRVTRGAPVPAPPPHLTLSASAVRPNLPVLKRA